MKQVILITGASSGIGRACADYLHQKNFQVIGTSRRRSEPGACPWEMIQMDVNDPVSVKKGTKHILDNHNRLDIVVNNAGFGIAGSIEDTSLDEIRSQFDTNFYGVVRVCQEILPIMRKQQNGCIINISSIAGLISVPFQGIYSASKFALEGLTESLRMEVKPFGIRVVLVAPGDFKTGFTGHRIIAEKAKTTTIYSDRFNKALHVMETDEKNGGDPIQIARLICRIISDPNPRSRCLTGPLLEQAAVHLKKYLPSRLFEWIIMKSYQV